MNDFEIKLVRYIHTFGKGRIDFLTAFIGSIRMLAALWSVALLITFVYFPNEWRVLFQRVAIVTALHFFISEGFFKYFLPRFFGARQRPFIAYPEKIKPIGRQFSDGSMPSSHMASTMAMIVVLSATFSTLILPGSVFAFFMGFARIHNGMHYLSDVVIGTLLGLLYGAIAVFFI